MKNTDYSIHVTADYPNRLYVSRASTGAEVFVDMDNVSDQETRIKVSVQKALKLLDAKAVVLEQIKTELLNQTKSD